MSDHDINKAIESGLKAQGKDGFSGEEGCACKLGNIVRCGLLPEECEAGYLVECVCGGHWHIQSERGDTIDPCPGHPET